MKLSSALKTGTKESHSMAENTNFVASFLKGVVSKDSYSQLLSNLYYVYDAMEQELNKLREDPLVGPIVMDELHRESSIGLDLRYFYGPCWRREMATKKCPSTDTYVHRIREIAKEEPYLLIAHHYTRYLGDLSGGQILKSIAQKALNLDQQGLAFYGFKRISDTKEFKKQYRERLDSLDLSEYQVNALVAEANYAFRLNMYMFDEITKDSNGIRSFLNVLFGFIFR